MLSSQHVDILYCTSWQLDRKIDLQGVARSLRRTTTSALQTALRRPLSTTRHCRAFQNSRHRASASPGRPFARHTPPGQRSRYTCRTHSSLHDGKLATLLFTTGCVLCSASHLAHTWASSPPARHTALASPSQSCLSALNAAPIPAPWLPPGTAATAASVVGVASITQDGSNEPAEL